MKQSAKILGTFFLTLSILSSFLLWATRIIDLRSQSMYFDQPNVIWYLLMHIGIIMTFFTLNASFKRPIYGMVAFASIATLIFDLGGFQNLHNISTAILFILASISIMLFEKNKVLAISLTSISAIFFLSGLFGWLGSSGIFLGETIAEILLGILIIKEIWINNKIK
jgi:hypothetical protein